MPLNPHFPTVVGLCADAPQSGKTTVAKHLEKVHGYVNVPNSTILKSMLRLFGLTQEQLNGDLKEYPAIQLGMVTPRRALQSLGEWMERELPRAWEDWWMDAACNVLDHGCGVINDSVRRQDEVDQIRRLGGVVIKIMRPDAPVDASHPAEQHTFEYDWTVVNSGSVGDLYAQVERVLFLHGR